MDKKMKIARWAIAAAMLTMPFMSLAAVTLPEGSAIDLDKIQALIERIANFLIVIGIIIAVIYIIWGGIRYMTARGEPKKADEAKAAIYNGIIGAAVVLGVGVILRTVAGLVTRSFFGAGQ